MPDTAIRIDALSHIYDDGTRALDAISLAITAGESVGLIGHNGSGKSTLLMHLVGILGPDERVRVGGLALSRATLPTIRRKLGYVFQNPRDQLFMSSVIEDVAFGPLNQGMTPHEALHAAEDALAKVGLAEAAARVPYHLSGGEMRRAAIASVLAMAPEIIVMDEPTAGLDPRGKRELARLIRGLGCTTLVASHDLDFIAACTDRIILLENGRLVAGGPSDIVIADMGLLLAHGL